MTATTIHSLIPDPEALLALEPEELAGVVLQHLNGLGPRDGGKMNRFSFSNPTTVQEFPPEYQERLCEALMEAWVWLEREGVLAPRPGAQGDWVFITRRGRRLTTPADFDAYRRASRLPRQLLHPRISQKVWASFLRGDYDVAVFQAFKEVEVQVRNAAGLRAEDIGVPLMRKAFDSESGILADQNGTKTERESLAHLFAGAIGSYKNPHSHRSVSIDADETVEMLVLASHLLGIVEKRHPEQAGTD